MAVLSKIRQRSLLLILVIGFCLLAFIVGDIFNSGGFNQTSNDVGSINGKDVAFEDFRMKVAAAEQGGQGITPTQAANRVWEQEIAIALLSDEFEKLGLRAGEKHIMESLKSDPNIGQNPMFQNAQGQFDEVKFKEYFRSNPEQMASLKDREKQAELNAKYQMYNTLVKAGVFTTEAEGKLQYQLEADRVSFDYVPVLYSSVPDSEVKVSDQEIVDFMKKNEKKYKADEHRVVEYVIIADKPSTEDENEVKAGVEALLNESVKYNKDTGKNDTVPGFRSAVNVADFVNANSDVQYDSSYVAKSDLPTAHAEQLFNLAEGEVYGPYIYEGYYCISKSLGRKAGAKAKASHILISYEGTQVPNKKEVRTKEEAKAKAESLLAQAKSNPSGFSMLAMTNSDDSSAQQGGDLGYFSPGQMVKPFNDYVFNNSIGSIGLVETDFGFHIINVTDKQDAIRLATIARSIRASEATSDELYQQAAQFEMNANDKGFEESAKAANLTINPAVKVAAMDESFGTVGNRREIVRWAFDKETDEGDVKRFEVPNVGHVVARLKKINAEGLLAIDEARLSVEPILKNRKKAEIIKNKMKGSTLEAIAKAAGSTVMQAGAVTLQSPVLQGSGAEPKVVGMAMSAAPNKVSEPIEGNTGVFVIMTKEVVKAPALQSHIDYVNKVKGQRMSFAGRLVPALKEEAEIEDNRSRFNY
ncbi:MAG: peptidylprolyl isomerase [Flavobacterium sp.]|nr:peptidylprolyl isomerase [Flavobacterium sp.]